MILPTSLYMPSNGTRVAEPVHIERSHRFRTRVYHSHPQISPCASGVIEFHSMRDAEFERCLNPYSYVKSSTAVVSAPGAGTFGIRLLPRCQLFRGGNIQACSPVVFVTEGRAVGMPGAADDRVKESFTFTSRISFIHAVPGTFFMQAPHRA